MIDRSLVVIWEIRYWDDGSGKKSLEKWLDKLPPEHFRSVAKELTILELAGNNLKMPHSKSLGDGLFELRERRYGYRIYYTFSGNKVIILLAAGNKKSQQNDIKAARMRFSK